VYRNDFTVSRDLGLNSCQDFLRFQPQTSLRLLFSGSIKSVIRDEQHRPKNGSQIKHLSFSLALALFIGVSWVANALPQLPNYYPMEFRESLETPESQKQIPRLLFEVLSKAHLSKDSSPDELIDSCPKKANCFKQLELSYKVARTHMFGELHLLQMNNKYAVKGVYCSKTLDESSFPEGARPGPGSIPSARVMNTEHTWPQSRFSRNFPKQLQKGDLHILFPVESPVNSLRSNYPFGEVSSVSQRPCASARKGRSGRSGRQVFEPADEHKGNVARALFYFSMRYKIDIDPEQEETLRAWDRSDPVDDFERQRNEKIFEIQKNRNPFIDYPELSQLISDF